MLLQIFGPTDTPWYKENPTWAAITLMAGFGLAITGCPGFNRGALWAEWPCISFFFWCVLNGISKNSWVRLYGRILIIAIVGLAVWRVDVLLAKSHSNTWRLSACSVVKDDRVREGQSARLTLRGPTTIEATDWSSRCRIPVGTEFHRENGFVCNPDIAGPNDFGCFGIESEKPR